MAEGGGGGFEISKAFVTVEARLKKESFDRARRDAAQRLKGAGQQPPGPGGSGPAPATPRPPAGPAPSGAAAPSVVPDNQTITSRLAAARAAFRAAGTDYGKALEGGFVAGLGNLGKIAGDRIREAQRAGAAQMANQTPARGGAGVSQAPTASTRAASARSAESPESIAQRFTQRFSAGLDRAAGRAREMAGGGATRATGGGGTTVNNYNTRVEIDPRRIQELLNVVKTVNQLKARNRARPSQAPLLKPGRGAQLRRTEVQRDPKEEARHQQIQRLRAQGRSIRDRLRGQVAAGLGSRAKAVWREDRHTRFKANLREKMRELGPGGRFRKTGQFYFNTKFRGAMYENRRETRNRALRMQAWQEKEAVRRQIAMLEGRPYRPTKRPKQGRAAYFRKSVQARGLGGRPGMYGYGTVQTRASGSRSRSSNNISFRRPRRITFRARGR